ncbi:hypothetical protein CF319_g8570 [Tilletia indica]|nr:hypothetical protein CF319_g8570 [Tilletia indica]
MSAIHRDDWGLVLQGPRRPCGNGKTDGDESRMLTIQGSAASWTQSNEDTTTRADDKPHFGKQPRAAASTPTVPSPPRSDHSSVGKGDHGGASHPHHALTPPTSHANDGSDRSDHHVGSPPATSSESKTEVSTSADTSTEADSSMPRLESVRPSKPKKVSMPDRNTTAEWDASDSWLKEATKLDDNEDDGGHQGAGTSSGKTVPKPTDCTIDVCRELDNSLTTLKLVQHAGELAITNPYGYHSGYNLGFNCAESVNFALDTWSEIGRNAGFCKCRTDTGAGRGGGLNASIRRARATVQGPHQHGGDAAFSNASIRGSLGAKLLRRGGETTASDFTMKAKLVREEEEDDIKTKVSSIGH